MKIKEAKSKVKKLGFKLKYDDCGCWHDDIVLSYWEKDDKRIIIVEDLDGGECTIFINVIEMKSS